MFLWYPSVVVYCSLHHTAVLTVIRDSYNYSYTHVLFLFSSSFAVDQEIATSRHHYLCWHYIYKLINILFIVMYAQ